MVTIHGTTSALLEDTLPLQKKLMVLEHLKEASVLHKTDPLHPTFGWLSCMELQAGLRAAQA
eukprot:3287502-Amphidinium_carterae.1